MTPRQRAIFGFILLGIWALLIAIIAIGHVEEATSFGLRDCITGLAFLSGAWAQSTFGEKPKDPTSPSVSPHESDSPPTQ